MDVMRLRSFVAVADLASFSRAADELGLAQPAVSQQIKRLEAELGAPLLERSTRRVGLTPAGARLLPRARAIVAETDRAVEDMRRAAEGDVGQVAVGFVGTATYDLLPRVSRHVRESLPGVGLDLFGEQLTPDLLEGVRAARLDLAVLRDPAPADDLVAIPLREESLVAALPVDHPGARGDSVALADLSTSVFVTHPSGQRSVMFDAVIRSCRAAGFRPREIVEARETATLMTFVAAGIGVALVPEPVRSLALDGVAYRRLSDVSTVTELALVMRRGDDAPATRRVADAIAQLVRGR